LTQLWHKSNLLVVQNDVGQPNVFGWDDELFNSAIFVRVPVQFGIEPSLKRQLLSQVKVENTLKFQFFKGLLEKEKLGALDFTQTRWREWNRGK
jgi:hypothetical protein